MHKSVLGTLITFEEPLLDPLYCFPNFLIFILNINNFLLNMSKLGTWMNEYKCKKVNEWMDASAKK